jgi:hypothetical protein
MIVAACNTPPVVDEDTRAAQAAHGAGDGGSAGGGEASDLYADFPAFCRAIGVAECSTAITERCGFPGATPEDCVGEVSRACSTRQSEITRAATSTEGYKKSAAEACAKAVSDSYARGQIEAADHRAITAACQEVFRLDRAVGEACSVDADCAVDLGCFLADTGAGACQKITTRAGGEGCGAVGDECGAGLHCGVDKVCTPRQKMGDECTPFSRPCAEALRCVIAVPDTGSGRCEARLGPGEICEADSECSSEFCALIGAQRQCVEALVPSIGSPVCDNFDGK